jgi:hypothetical protein
MYPCGEAKKRKKGGKRGIYGVSGAKIAKRGGQEK